MYEVKVCSLLYNLPSQFSQIQVSMENLKFRNKKKMAELLSVDHHSAP